ncbi:hypothetical protein C1645_837525 [Glomus cerebriforme]|uniref:F-box domain-containing protein n=1 Tax=Glomus cerebriforme TaxID=658196 RepID=A0A397S3W7_9GLOM|nr:hypothetical protein C1645_837525 [Glomus cerebriforme]
MSQLLADCLNEIFEYLENDMVTLHSCLLVNRIWCEVSVKFFWRNIWKYRDSNYRTLIACLPTESKEILLKKGINISTLTSKPPIFNYASFCKILPIHRVGYKLKMILRHDKQYKQWQNLCNDSYILEQEIYKLYMSQIGSLRKLELILNMDWNIAFAFYPGAEDCLKNLSELSYDSDISTELFFQLSQICHNILSLNINYRNHISKELTDLISVQENLKYLSINQFTDESLKQIITSIKNPNNLSKLSIYGEEQPSLLFITKFTNLQELDLSIGKFEILQHVIFPQLQILKIYEKFELLTKFIENNGKNLRELYIIHEDYCYSNDSSNLAIAKSCPNLRKLFVGFKNNELETLKIAFKNCLYLETIKIWCGGNFLSEKEALEMVLKYSHKNLYKVILYHQDYTKSKLLPEELESFFISWANRVPQKSLSLLINDCDYYYNARNSLNKSAENMKIIEKYIKLGVIREFEVN